MEGLASRRKVLGARLLDTRAMKYNNDETTLRSQRKAKRLKDAEDKRLAKEADAYEKAMNAECERYARIKHIEKLKEKKRLEDYWAMQRRAKATTNPEFDLNDPLALKKDKPARIGDNDSRCGVSSLQMFDGEDLGMPQRVAQQTKSLLAARERQIVASNAAKAEEQQRQRDYANFVAETNRIRKMNAIAKERQRRYDNLVLSQTNKALARSFAEEQNRIKAEADALERLETKLLRSNLRLAEDTSVSGKSQLGPNRYRTDHFKGFSAAHRQTFYAENARQMKEKQDIQAAEAAHEAGYAAHVKRMNDIAREQSYKRAVKQREDEMLLKMEQKLHSRQHKARELTDQKRIMDQKVTEQFLGKFGHLQQ